MSLKRQKNQICIHAKWMEVGSPLCESTMQILQILIVRSLQTWGVPAPNQLL